MVQSSRAGTQQLFILEIESDDTVETSIRIQALKYGNRPHYEWDTVLLERTDSYILVAGKRGRKLRHHTKQKVFTMDSWTIELFPFDSWFTVSADVMDGRIRQYYCNINEPAKLTDHIVSFVDLDLDYVQRDGEWKVVDEDEFASNAKLYAYPEELMARARQELVNLQNRVHSKQFPFDGTLERWIGMIPSEG